MSTLSDVDIQLNNDERVIVEITAQLHADWKQYSINIQSDDAVRIFSNNIHSGAQELSVSPELLKEIMTDAGVEYNSSLTIIDLAKKLINHINDLEKPQVIRTIHPVGQGAMYSERFLNKEGETNFLAVYDCGSDNLRKLEREISASFTKTDNIDLLFISHLDKEHINGIRKLKDAVNSIKTVILPLIPASQKCIYLLMEDEISRRIILEPEKFFSDSNIVKVKSVSESKGTSDSLIYPLDDVQTLESGTIIRLNDHSDPDWCYIPYNYDESERLNDFDKKLSDEDIEKSRLNDPDYIDQHKDRLKKIYKDVCDGSVNNSSLVVYSGGLCTEYSSKYIHNTIRNSRHSGEACLYLGDADMNQTQINAKTMVDDLKCNLNTHMVNNHISTVQLPHHGSVKNFHNGLLSYGLASKLYFASFGQNNHHGHPSTLTAGLIAARNEIFCAVTEMRDSAIIQVIKKV